LCIIHCLLYVCLAQERCFGRHTVNAPSPKDGRASTYGVIGVHPNQQKFYAVLS
jgi:hypothetical protein